MHLPRPARTAALLAASALVAAALAVAPAASAAPVFVDADTEVTSEAGGGINAGGCPVTNAANGSPDIAVAENGAPVSVSTTTSGSTTGGGPDTATFQAQSSGTASVRSLGGNPRSLDLTVAGSGTITTSLAESACEYYVYAGHELNFRFTVAQAGFLHLETKAPAGTYGEVEIDSDTSSASDPYFQHRGYGLKFSGTTSVYLPAGTYYGGFEGYVDFASRATRAVSGTVSVRGTFNVAGSQTEAATGKGAKFVTLPASRSCATGSLDPSVTGAKKAAAKIKVVKYFVDDALVKKVRTPRKGAVTVLPVAADRAVDLTAEVTLKPGKKGAKAKVREVSASYEACS